MQKKVLVAYASKYGATEEIAERIGLILSQSGLLVDVLPVYDTASLEPYQAIVMGCAVYFGQWRRPAIKFLKNNKRELADKDVWLFSSGPTGKGNPVEIMKGWKYPPTLQLVMSTIKPHDIALFHGQLSLDKMNVFERFIISKIKAPVGDFREWDVIEEWAKNIAQQLNTPH
ncbi:flavodoxin domain-containing protein [Paludibacter jiangxiensis]|uniref:Menaquinone-dependent protoporphyrinogen oxidase n=1 Tax=Paludibacter jiangxiensis TaxID=681398 RepID=A0A171AEW7_9BACT|nr:flavodoxin domain-containing protein [Paludibacter jiangxiensis]GAT63619.1 menaquinone-dependent protoporphyrinogen oxidase [Paludibacter jiangxiensis]